LQESRCLPASLLSELKRKRNQNQTDNQNRHHKFPRPTHSLSPPPAIVPHSVAVAQMTIS
jgi:hypothetical protein